MQTAIVARMVAEKSWEGAVIEAGKFKRALVGNNIADWASAALVGVLPTAVASIPGTEIEISVNISTPEELDTEVIR
jgi:hypothetical protein